MKVQTKHSKTYLKTKDNGPNETKNKARIAINDVFGSNGLQTDLMSRFHKGLNKTITMKNYLTLV